MILDTYPNLLQVASTSSDGNMSFIKGDPKVVLENRKKFLDKYGISLEQIIVMSPVHETKIIEVNREDLGEGSGRVEDALKVDGLITNEEEVFLFLLTADCLPITIYDPIHRAIGLIHAGWLGLDRGIIQTSIKTFQDKFDSNPEDLKIYIGPSIGPCCYIKANTAEAEQNPIWQPYLKKTGSGTSIDLWQFTHDQLTKLGIKAENIDNPKICTYHTNEYFSNRKFKAESLANDFRFATILGIKSSFLQKI